jgi:hypothetical protein
MIILGLILVRQKPVLWVGLAAVVAIQTIRTWREARVREEAFGDLYRSTVARLGFENVILSNAARAPVFALAPVNT